MFVLLIGHTNDLYAAIIAIFKFAVQRYYSASLSLTVNSAVLWTLIH